MNPYSIKEKDLLDCRIEIPQQVGELLDDHEKLLDLLEESNTPCNVHNAQLNVLKFNEMGREDKSSEKARFEGERMKFLSYKWDLEKDELSPGLGEL